MNSLSGGCPPAVCRPFVSTGEAESGEQWIVPFGGGFGKVQRIGKLPVNFQIQAFYNVVKPEFGPDWQLRLQVQPIVPK